MYIYTALAPVSVFGENCVQAFRVKICPGDCSFGARRAMMLSAAGCGKLENETRDARWRCGGERRRRYFYWLGSNPYRKTDLRTDLGKSSARAYGERERKRD